MNRLPEDQLLEKIRALHAAFFDAYNNCDLVKLASFLAGDVEFYHDQGGVTLGREDLTDSVKKNVCGKVKRLLPSNLQVFRMKGYGALEMGSHRFHDVRDSPESMSEAKFTMLWQDKGGVWKLTRIGSYDHHVVPK